MLLAKWMSTFGASLAVAVVPCSAETASSNSDAAADAAGCSSSGGNGSSGSAGSSGGQRLVRKRWLFDGGWRRQRRVLVLSRRPIRGERRYARRRHVRGPGE